ncbi:MAG: cell division protein FtsH [Candidatus Marinimicrobia bacterium]|nr:cell division protein FtsH [Candidatus Neomarinimicrobiota bacterium]
MLLVVVIVSIMNVFVNESSVKKYDFRQFNSQLESNNIKEIVCTGTEESDCLGETKDGQRFSITLPDITKYEDRMVNILTFKPRTPGFFDYFMSFAPWLLIIFFWFFIMRRMQGGGGQSGIFNFAKSKARIVSADKPITTFDNVAGCDEAKFELQEIVGFLKNPRKYNKIGAKIPKGALLLGSPGTGKTLLAKAVSGEAGVPFFSISGAEFVEMFVGIGASRVRDLFSQAKRNSPSIIFIDEIDAVGRHRGAGLGGGHDEREQTLNQILVEMDGFGTDENVILLAATNRPDVLDKALLRPGRFDRQIIVDVPDMKGREGILKIHSKKIPIDKTVDLGVVAKSTPGLVGADLENLVNEAALHAARKNRKKVSMIDFDEAKDKIMMGVERKSMIMPEHERKITAYHEAGHALVAEYTKNSDPVHKVTIIPRGRALGLTAQLPSEDKHNYSKGYLMGRLDILMGGRSAEKLIFNDTTTGASNDISVATNLAKNMVTQWGMSDSIGPMYFKTGSDDVFLGREISYGRDYSDDLSSLIDKEVTNFIKKAEKNADCILKENLKDLHNIAKALLEKETITGDEMKQIIEQGDFSTTAESDSLKSTKRKRRSSEQK